MSLHGWLRKAMGTSPRNARVNKDPSKDGNDVFKGGDKHGMEYRPVVRKPYWEQKADVIPSEK